MTRDVNMLPNHLPSITGQRQNCENHSSYGCKGGCASSVMTTLLYAFKSKLLRANCSTNASKRLPSFNMRLHKNEDVVTQVGTSVHQVETHIIAHCNTARNKRGPSTCPCRTPPVILNFLLCPMSPTTSPDCPKHTHCQIHTRWSEIPLSTRAFHNAGQCTRSNAFDKSRLLFTQGYPTSRWLCRGVLPVVVPAETHVVLAAGCPASRNCSRCPSRKYAMAVLINEGNWSKIGRL